MSCNRDRWSPALVSSRVNEVTPSRLPSQVPRRNGCCADADVVAPRRIATTARESPQRCQDVPCSSLDMAPAAGLEAHLPRDLAIVTGPAELAPLDRVHRDGIG